MSNATQFIGSGNALRKDVMFTIALLWTTIGGIGLLASSFILYVDSRYSGIDPAFMWAANLSLLMVGIGVVLLMVSHSTTEDRKATVLGSVTGVSLNQIDPAACSLEQVDQGAEGGRRSAGYQQVRFSHR